MMEVQELETSHIELTEEKLRLLEIQVAALISDVIMLKAWKSEMSKLNLSPDISRTQSEAVVPTSAIKQEQLSSAIMEVAKVEKAAQECSDTSISCVQPEAVVPTLDVKQEQVVSDTITEVANNQITQSSDTDVSCVQPESVVPTCDTKQEQIIIDTVTETANHKEAAQSSDTSISSIQSDSVAPTSDVKQGQVVNDTIMEMAKDQKMPQECSATSTLRIQSEAMVPISDVKEEQVASDTITETAKNEKALQECSGTSILCIQSESVAPTSDVEQEKVVNDSVIETPNAEEHSDTGISESSCASAVENTSTEKCDIPTHEETSPTAVDAQERMSETAGATQESKEGNSWIELIEEEEQLSPTKCVPSEQGLKQSGSSSQESKEHGATPCRIGNKHSVLEKLVQSTVKFGASESANKRNTSIDSSKHRQKTDSHSPGKQKTELHNAGDGNKKTMCSPDKHKSVASSVHTNQDDDAKQELQSKDQPKEVEKNSLIAYMMKHNALLQQKKAEEEQTMQDTSVAIKEKKCQTCQCKIATPKRTQGSEEVDALSVEVVKKMSKEKLEKKYLQMVKRHQTLVNAICDSSTLRFPDDPHALLNAARNGNLEEAILLTFSPAMMEFRDEDGYAPLHLAVWSEHIHICKLLLAYNMPVNVKDNQGNTPLHFAARKGSVDICIVLLNWLAVLNATNTSGSTPLHCAVKEGHGEVCFLLVNKGALVNLGDKWNNTALHMAACNGFLEICQLLVKHGADVNSQNCMGNTPLHNACKAGHFEVIQYLVKKGARLSIRCNKGKTPKDVINTLTHSNVLEWLTKWEKRMCSDLDRILVNVN